ncbi:hypothetical protein [uncultured Thalassospira sp.]|uniref:hypothetical protein n=1 Tax=uncultured Thalassospira sp. TaxID=404382 RepID=UPI002585AEE2|nr:hypothetical protein [uncultured Thalassospira sp.]
MKKKFYAASSACACLLLAGCPSSLYYQKAVSPEPQREYITTSVNSLDSKNKKFTKSVNAHEGYFVFTSKYLTVDDPDFRKIPDKILEKLPDPISKDKVCGFNEHDNTAERLSKAVSVTKTSRTGIVLAIKPGEKVPITNSYDENAFKNISLPIHFMSLEDPDKGEAAKCLFDPNKYVATLPKTWDPEEEVALQLFYSVQKSDNNNIENIGTAITTVSNFSKNLLVGGSLVFNAVGEQDVDEFFRKIGNFYKSYTNYYAPDSLEIKFSRRNGILAHYLPVIFQTDAEDPSTRLLAGMIKIQLEAFPTMLTITEAKIQTESGYPDFSEVSLSYIPENLRASFKEYSTGQKPTSNLTSLILGSRGERNADVSEFSKVCKHIAYEAENSFKLGRIDRAAVVEIYASTQSRYSDNPKSTPLPTRKQIIDQLGATRGENDIKKRLEKLANELAEIEKHLDFLNSECLSEFTTDDLAEKLKLHTASKRDSFEQRRDLVISSIADLSPPEKNFYENVEHIFSTLRREYLGYSINHDRRKNTNDLVKFFNFPLIVEEYSSGLQHSSHVTNDIGQYQYDEKQLANFFRQIAPQHLGCHEVENVDQLVSDQHFATVLINEQLDPQSPKPGAYLVSGKVAQEAGTKDHKIIELVFDDITHSHVQYYEGRNAQADISTQDIPACVTNKVIECAKERLQSPDSCEKIRN